MRCEVINIRTVSDGEYRDISARQSDELKKRLENCSEDDIKRTLAGRLLLERMIKREFFRKLKAAFCMQSFFMLNDFSVVDFGLAMCRVA